MSSTKFTIPAASFHLQNQSPFLFAGTSPSLTVPTKPQEPRYVIEQTRALGYRVFLHQHPYVQPLIQRLIRAGTSGLQAVDTDFAEGEISVPYGVDLQLEKGTNTALKSGTKLKLLEDMIVQDPTGVNLPLAKGDELTLAADAVVKVFAGTRVTLVHAELNTQLPRVTYNLSASRSAAFFADAPIEFNAPANFIWGKNDQIIIPAGKRAVAAVATEFEIAKDTAVTLLRRNMQPKNEFFADFFKGTYAPNEFLVRKPFPVKDLDFTPSGAYSIYNWELFFHVPLTMAMHLSKNQRFAEAQQWFHYIFDPTDSSAGPTPERFWKVRPFQYTDVQKVEEILVNLSTNADPTLKEDTANSINAWKEAPFRPHVIARHRQQAYMFKTLMAYLDNLIAWGDSLYKQETGEAIDEAVQIYVMAANLLGPRPLPVPKKGTVRPQNYANLRKDLNEFGNVLREVEASIGFDLMPLPAVDMGGEERLINIQSLGKALYFCVPRNDKMLSYWDTVADRLFKIRNSLNFQGLFRQLALFEPPIDPALLARATAAGLDIGAEINGLNQPLPLVRFAFLVQKAAEIAQEVKSLGSNLLSAMEKEDGETMAILRATQERIVMGMVEQVKYGQLQEAIKAKEGLLQTLALAVQRYTYNELQLGKKAEEIEQAIPELHELEKQDKENLAKMKFAVTEPVVKSREIKVDIAQDLGGSGGKIIGSHESEELRLLKSARNQQVNVATGESMASQLSFIPQFDAKGAPLGVGVAAGFGGVQLSKAASMIASSIRTNADQFSYEANQSAKIGIYARREQDWSYQSNLAAGEITQIFKQLRGAQIREAVADMELRNHRKQMEHAAEIEKFLNEEGSEKTGKKTNKAFYAWMRRDLRGLYAQCFQFAFDIATKAGRALQHELGNTELNYLQYGYLAGKEGLLAGEKLYLDIKRMEMAYHDQNEREYELTKHVSVMQLNPLALIQLRTTGRCIVDLPEELFDMDGPGHYFRRIKNLAVSIPCVTGPYSSVNCTLTLLKSSIRKTPLLHDGNEEPYKREGAEDNRFSDHFGSLQSVVTSSAQNDSGLFETNLRDERYLPFENSGVIFTCQLQLPADPSKKEPLQFDYQTISDVILHIRYTAREGGNLLRSAAKKYLAKASGMVRLFSIREEFRSEWLKFEKSTVARRELTLELQEFHFPFWLQGLVNNRDEHNATKVEIFARSKEPHLEIGYKNSANAELICKLTKDTFLGGLLRGELKVGSKNEELLLELPTSKLALHFNNEDITDIWIAISLGEH